MKKGEVVLILYSFTDLSFTKVRPVLVISNDAYNTKQDDIVLLLITSNTSRLSPHVYTLNTNDPGFKDTGLKKTSVFRVGKIQTLNKTLLNSRLDFVGPNTIKEIEERLRNLLQL